MIMNTFIRQAIDRNKTDRERETERQTNTVYIIVENTPATHAANSS